MSVSLILFRVWRYAMYWLKKANGHSLHSPFVFSLYNECLKNHRFLPDLVPVEAIRLSMQKDNRIFKEKTKGAESSIGKNQVISRIANVGISNSSHSKLLKSLIERYKLSNVLELGTSLGINTMYLASSGGVNSVVTVDGDRNISIIAQENFQKAQFQNIQTVCSDIDEYLMNSLELKDKFDFIFIDANHKKDPTLRYFEQCQKFGSERLIIVIDDINWSREMRDAWNDIKERSEVCLTIENYQFGIVFSSNHSTEGHYILDF